MNKQLLQKHIRSFAKRYSSASPEVLADKEERALERHRSEYRQLNANTIPVHFDKFVVSQSQ